MFAGAAFGAVSIGIVGVAPTESRAQATAPSILPPVTVDAPQRRARAASTRPSRVTRTVQRRPAERAPVAVAPVSIIGSTRTIGAPPQAYAGGQIATGQTLGLLGSTSVMNAPFSTVSFTSQLIQDQQARTTADTLINDASVRATTGANGYGDAFQIRGFRVPSADIGLNGLYGLVSFNRLPSEIIERIDLLKGPGALINGIAPGGTIGGGINVVTKRAPDVPFARLTPIFMSAGNYGLWLESSRRFGADKEWGVRFNGLGRNGEYTINDGNLQTGLGALGIDYRGERLRWTLDLISQNDNTRAMRPQMTVQPNIALIPAPPDSRSTWYPGTMTRQRDNTVATSLEYDIAESLTAYAGLGYLEGTDYRTFPDARQSSGIDQLGNFRLNNGYYDSYTKTVSGNVGLRSRFDTGFITHRANVVFTGLNSEVGTASLTNSAAQSVPSNIYNPAPLPVVTGTRLPPQKASDTTLTSVAIADTMSVLDETVLVTLGVRRQQVQQDSFNNRTGVLTGSYDAGATTPLAGIVVKPLKNVSIYANYAEGLTQGAIVGPGYSNTGDILAPYKSKQKEVGVKVDWGTVTTTAAAFEIARPNSIRTASDSLAYDGEQRNRGLEFSAYGLFQPGLRGFGSVAFVRPELTNPTIGSQKGKDAAGVPNTTLSAGLDWDTPWIAGLSLNGRVIYTASSYQTNDNILKFPDWTRVDIGARYATAINGRPVTIRANIENLFDKTYWLWDGSFATVAAPRTYILSASFDF